MSVVDPLIGIQHQDSKTTLLYLPYRHNNHLEMKIRRNHPIEKQHGYYGMYSLDICYTYGTQKQFNPLCSQVTFMIGLTDPQFKNVGASLAVVLTQLKQTLLKDPVFNLTTSGHQQIFEKVVADTVNNNWDILGIKLNVSPRRFSFTETKHSECKRVFFWRMKLDVFGAVVSTNSDPTIPKSQYGTYNQYPFHLFIGKIAIEPTIMVPTWTQCFELLTLWEDEWIRIYRKRKGNSQETTVEEIERQILDEMQSGIDMDFLLQRVLKKIGYNKFKTLD